MRRDNLWMRRIFVTCPRCKERFNEGAVRVEDIEEDIQGRDLLSFWCPVCEQTVKAYRVGG